MKKTIGTLLVFTMISLGAFAQGRGPGERMDPEKRAEMQTKRMSEELKLTEEQQKKVLALNIERSKKLQELNRGEALKRQEIRESYQKDLNQILTTEQQNKLKEHQQGRRGPRDGVDRNRRHRPGQPR